MTVEQEVAPLVKKVVVPVGPERAFEAFTAEMSAWWPLGSAFGRAGRRRARCDSRVPWAGGSSSTTTMARSDLGDGVGLGSAEVGEFHVASGRVIRSRRVT